MRKRTNTFLLTWAVLALLLVIIGGWLTEIRYMAGFGCAMAVTSALVLLLERGGRAS